MNVDRGRFRRKAGATCLILSLPGSTMCFNFELKAVHEKFLNSTLKIQNSKF
jgi:hypothetical protein